MPDDEQNPTDWTPPRVTPRLYTPREALMIRRSRVTRLMRMYPRLNIAWFERTWRRRHG